MHISLVNEFLSKNHRCFRQYDMLLADNQLFFLNIDILVKSIKYKIPIHLKKKYYSITTYNNVYLLKN